MPELPEVETLRRELVTLIRGQKIKAITVRKPKLVSGKGNIRSASSRKVKEFIAELRGETITDIARRAKNLIVHFKSGKLLLVHLKMTGQLVYVERVTRLADGGRPNKLSGIKLPGQHTHIIFELNRGTLYYNDLRKFGYLLYYPNLKKLEATGHFSEIGLDPLDSEFTLKRFAQVIQERKGRLKTALMSQKIVGGFGNIYSDEVCFAARVRPTQNTRSLKRGEVDALYRAIKTTLRRAIRLGGSSVVNYRRADGSRGSYSKELRVYGRGGEPCYICRTPLSKIKMGGRTTVFCKKCQR